MMTNNYFAIAYRSALWMDAQLSGQSHERGCYLSRLGIRVDTGL